ncbi:acyltransferase domain-containing protein [Vibrio sp. PP-XX7]
MAAELYARYPEFRRCIDELAAILKPVWPHDLVALLTDKDIPQASLNQTEITQVIVVAYEIALAQLWLHWGVTPEFCVGHSIGEIAAAVISNSLTAKNAIYWPLPEDKLSRRYPAAVQWLRWRLIFRPFRRSLIGFRGVITPMIAIAWWWQHIIRRITRRFPVRKKPLKRVSTQLSAAGIRARRLDVSHAFHSPLLREAMASFSDVVSKIAFKPPVCQVISTLTGKPVTPLDWQRPEYWVNQLIQPVLFCEAMTHLPQGAEISQSGSTLVLEIAPKPTLFVLGKQCCPTLSWVCSQNREQAASSLQDAVSRLYRSGINLNWHHFLALARMIVTRGYSSPRHYHFIHFSNIVTNRRNLRWHRRWFYLKLRIIHRFVQRPRTPLARSRQSTIPHIRWSVQSKVIHVSKPAPKQAPQQMPKPTSKPR